MTLTRLTSRIRTRLGRGLGTLLACAALSLTHGASAQTLFVDEGVTDHTGHSHTFELIDEIVTGATPFDLDLADLSFSDIEDSDFPDAILTDAILDNVYIRNSIFTDADFTGASIRRAIVRGGNFDGADFSGADLSNTQWSCAPDPDGDSSSAFPDLCPTFIAADFMAADLTSVFFGPETAGDEFVFSAADFRGANLTDAVFAGLSEPCLAPISPATAWSCLRWGDEPASAPNTVVAGLTLLSNSDLRGSDMRNLDFDASDFSGGLIAGIRFAGSTFADTTFDGVVSSCAVLDAADPEAAPEAALCTFFTDTPAEYPAGIKADFRNTAISDTSFVGAGLGGVDFTDAIFSNVVLDAADLGCTTSSNGIDDFDEDCGDCAVFSGVFIDTGLVAGKHNIRMRSVSFDDILACSVIRPGAALIDDFNYMDLDSAIFSDANVLAAGVDFIGSSLVLADFSNAVVSSTDFSGADLTSALLTGADFSDATFDGAVLDGATAIGSTFSRASFMGSSTSLVGAVMTSAIFDDASFADADLTGANLSVTNMQGATFTDSDLGNVNFSSADLRGTTFAVASGVSNLSGANLSNAQVDSATSLGGSRIDGINLTGVDLTSSPDFFLGTAAFVPGAGQTASDAQGVDLTSRDLTGFDFSGLTLTNWRFDSTVLMGTDFTGATLDGARLTNLQFNDYFSSLVYDDETSFAGVNFSGSNLSGLDLANFDLSGTNLTGTSVTGTSFAGANLSRAALVSLVAVCNGTVDCAEFTGANLYCADLGSAGFASFVTRDGADCTGNLESATELFQSVVLTDPDMLAPGSGIQLRNATLQDYNFFNLDLRGANLENSDVSGANFSGAMLDGTSMAGATICRTVDVTTTCASFSIATSLVGDTDCDEQEAIDFGSTDFSEVPAGFFDSSTDFSCVNFTDANLSDDVAALTTGFSFDPSMTWDGAVLAGADLRYQDFSKPGLDDFFTVLGHAAESRKDICATVAQIIAPIDTTPDLRSTNFSCATLTGQDMSNADLRDAKFVRATIGGTGFSLTGAELEGADFADVDFGVANLADIFEDVSKVTENDGVTLVTDDADVPYENLKRVSFAHADLELTSGSLDLSHVDLSGANLVGANLTGANLFDAILDDLAKSGDVTALCGTVAASTEACAPLEQTTVSCLVLDDANVEGASFQNIDFRNLFVGGTTGADFFQRVAIQSIDSRDLPNLSRTDFSGANIAGMNFDNLNLTDAALFSLAPVCDENACASFEKSIFGSSMPEILVNFSGRDFMTASIAGAKFDNVSLANVDFTEVGNLCTTDMTPVCLTITGKNSSLLSADFSGLDLTLVSFGTGADKVINFGFAQFTNADLSALDLSGRDFTGVDFTAADLSGVNFEMATLANSVSGCNTDTGTTVCTNFTGANLCGVDARGAQFEGSFADVSTATTVTCTISATFSGATFVNVDFVNDPNDPNDTTNFTNANLDNAFFDPTVTFCAPTEEDCLVITGASLVGATLSGFDFSTAPVGYFADVLNDNLREIDFSSSDLSGKDFTNADLSFANLSQSDLNGASLIGADFNKTQFALGAVSEGSSCTLATGAIAVDLRGADLRNADFSRALHFQRGCILVDATTLYDVNTEFPPGFDLLAELTLGAPAPAGSGGTAIPEPNSFLLRGTALALLGLLAWRRRSRR